MSDRTFNLIIQEPVLPQEILDQAELITVEQEMDTAWEARIKLPLLMDQLGNWQEFSLHTFAELPRVRVEVQIGENDSTALIDGPLVGLETPQSSNPGQSSIILIVQDDTHNLDRQQVQSSYDIDDLRGVVSEVFQEGDSIAPPDVEDIPAFQQDTPNTRINRRDTAIKFLQKLAQQFHFHAWVMPSQEQWNSNAYFRSAPATISGYDLDPLVLVGAGQNILNFHFTDNSSNAALFITSALGSINEHLEAVESQENEETQGEGEAVPRDRQRTLLLSPDDITPENMQNLSQNAADATGYVYEVTGQTNLECYKSVMFPYLAVDVTGVGENKSGNYLIKKVTHEIDKFGYRQSFTLVRNGVSVSDSMAAIPGSEVI